MSDSIEIYDPGAIGSDLHEDSMFHNPEVIADSIGEVKVEKEKPKKKPKKYKWQEDLDTGGKI